MSQDNRGKATAGVDNISKLSPEQRLKLARKLCRWAKNRYKDAERAKQKCFNVKGWNFGYTKERKSYILNRHDQNKK